CDRQSRIDKGFGDAVGQAVIGEAEATRHSQGDRASSFAEGERGRNRPDEVIVRRVESGIETLAGNIGAKGAEELAEALLPRHAVGVQGAAEVEEHRRSCDFSPPLAAAPEGRLTAALRNRPHVSENSGGGEWTGTARGLIAEGRAHFSRRREGPAGEV